MDDAAIARAINLADWIDEDTRTPKTSILVAQLASAREEAIEATRQLLIADPFDAKQILSLQGEVKRFAELVVWLGNARNQARDAFALLPIEEQGEVLSFIRENRGHHNRKVNDA